MPTVPKSFDVVKAELLQQYSATLDALFARADGPATARELEEQTWKAILPCCAALFCALLCVRARRIAEQDIARRQLEPSRVCWRMDRDYWATVMSTFGPITFAWSAYRVRAPDGASVTFNPVQSILFPAFKACRSTSLCLQWETRLGSEQAFRHAQQAIGFFSHGAVSLEDTTIARHMVRIGQLVSRQDMYRTPEEIRQILSERATRDRQTNRPLLYMSSDAHALRRFVDDSWAAAWKMVNGLRFWCENKETGEIIHLGGEFTWGDCRDVKAIFEDLIHRGILPADGDYGQGVHAHLVWLSDGMPWFKEHIHPLFPELVVILDVYHLLQAFAAYIALCCEPGSEQARMYRQLATELALGPRPKRGAKARRRRGHVKGCAKNAEHHAHQREVEPEPQGSFLKLLLEIAAPTLKAQKVRWRLFDFLDSDRERIKYREFRARGYQIGSGAMESIHRPGSQQRLKLPGAKWLESTSQSIFNIRMMRLVGNEERFWSQPDLEARFAAVKMAV